MRNGIDYFLENVDKKEFPAKVVSRKEMYDDIRSFRTDSAYDLKIKHKEAAERERRIERMRKEYLKHVTG